MAVSPHSYFVTGSNDQTLAIWHPGRSEPVLSLFVAGRDWVAWTPEGYYGASADGEKMMGWLTNNGSNKLATVSSPQAFRQSLYKPEALRGLWLAGGNIQLALARVSGGGGSATLVPRQASPDVVIKSPRAGGKLTDRVLVKAEATSKGESPVTSMRLLVDGRPYLGTRGVKSIPAPKLGTASTEWDIDLMPGKHVLVVQADTKSARAARRRWR